MSILNGLSHTESINRINDLYELGLIDNQTRVKTLNALSANTTRKNQFRHCMPMPVA